MGCHFLLQGIFLTQGLNLCLQCPLQAGSLPTKSYIYIYIFYSTNWINGRRQWHPTPVLLPGKSHGQRRLVGCSPWGRYESDTTERLHFQFSLSCIGEGNGNPLQCSCLENPRDSRAWWAAVYGITWSRTWLKQLNSGSNWINHLVCVLQTHVRRVELCLFINL